MSFNKNKEDVPNNCPHCGRELSPWEKVLLSVDRALMCKNCWYRIILGVKMKNSDDNSEISKDKQDEKKD